ncbi:hypothetical protein [Falsiporphyromonas endometrii]|uniref:T9SS type A sorting domain-containing protein n=1 Tax=Falsiporphyromonas endometrii TaxID=1387297 RepID=A0ABV9K7Q3_9PORP
MKLKKILLFFSVVYAPILGYAQSDKLLLSSKVDSVLLSEFKEPDLRATGSVDQPYQYPVALSWLGTIDAKKVGIPYCNYLSFNSSNKGVRYWAAINKPIRYQLNIDPSFVNSWESLGGKPKTSSDDNYLEVEYQEEALYSFPRLNYDSDKSYQALGSLLVGGKAEIAPVDMSERGKTYELGALQLSGKDGTFAGYLGGTNSSGIYGYGNLYMISQEESYMTGVNVYLFKKPEKYEKEAKLILRVWMPGEVNGDFKLNNIPIEYAECYFSNIRSFNPNEVPLKDGAIAHFSFDRPISMYGKPMIFISIEGFSSDPTKEDFIMLMDLKGKEMSDSDVYNKLSHNSFVRFNNSDTNGEYLYPINQFGAPMGASLMICPILDSQGKDVLAVSTPLSEEDVSVKIVGDNVAISTSNSDYKEVMVFNTVGQLVTRSVMEDNVCNIVLPGGSYILLLKSISGKDYIKRFLIN